MTWKHIEGTFEEDPQFKVWTRRELDRWAMGPHNERQGRRKHHHPPSDKEKRSVVAAYGQGIGVQAIAKRYHRAHTTIENILEEEGILRRRYSKRRG